MTHEIPLERRTLQGHFSPELEPVVAGVVPICATPSPADPELPQPDASNPAVAISVSARNALFTVFAISSSFRLAELV